MTGAGKAVVGIVVGVPLLLMAGCGVILMTGGSGDGTASIEARNQCQEWVSDQLRAPSTARYSAVSATGGPSEWTVTGAVEAENGFGGMVRETWSCTIRLDGNTWRGSAALN